MRSPGLEINPPGGGSQPASSLADLDDVPVVIDNPAEKEHLARIMRQARLHST